MKRHVKRREVSGYVLGTLTDAQREVIDRHLVGCAECRSRISAEEGVRREIWRGVQAAGQAVSPGEKMNFREMRGRLAGERRQARVVYWAQQVGGVAAVVAALVIVFVVVSAAVQNQVTLDEENVAALTGEPLFDVAWDDVTPYSGGLIAAEQGVLRTVADSTVYQVDVVLADDLERLDGRVAIRYVNGSGGDLNELFVRLLPNAGSSELVVESVRVAGRPVVSRLQTPLDLQLVLAEPLAAGESVVINVEFGMEIGRTRANFPGTVGFIDGSLNLAHFFPVMAAHERGEWWLDEPLHGIGSVVGDGFYVVQVNAPERLMLIGSGVQLERQVVQGQSGAAARQVVRYAAGPVNQFVLIGSEAYGTAASRTVGETTITVHGYADYLAEDVTAAAGYAAEAFGAYEELFGPYPFTELQLVGTTALRVDVQVMGYPGLAMMEMDRFVLGESSLEQNVVYGVAYQWFGRASRRQMLMEPWWGVGLSEYVLRYYAAQKGGDQAVAELQAGWARQMSRVASLDPLVARYDVTSYREGGFYPLMTVAGPLLIQQVVDEVGDEVFLEGVRHYYQQQRWELGAPLSVGKYVESACGCVSSVLSDVGE